MHHHNIRVSIADELHRQQIFDTLLRNRLYIRGVEVTQAIQYQRASEHLTDPADQQDDNAVRLVANKPAWVRVYVHSLWADTENVTGTLGVAHMRWGVIPDSIGTLSPQPPGSITARANPDYATERGTLGWSLNFVIPADWMEGRLRLDVRVESGSASDQETRFVDASLRQTLRLAGIMVGYNGSNGAPVNPQNITRPAPTLANLQATAPFTLTTMPVQSTGTYRLAGTITWTQPLTDAPSCAGCCSPNWVALNAAVQQVRVNDGNRTDVIYYGLMANGIPMGPIIGCNSGGVSTSQNGDQVTMAHEIGHYLGLAHAPCGTPGDPNYPAYEPYDPAGTPNASIGEYGLNINNGAVMSPQTFKDYMSYCGPGWISPYHYGRLLNLQLLDPRLVDQGEPWWEDWLMYDPNLIPERWLPDPPPDPLEWRRFQMQLQPVISLIGIVREDDQIDVQSVVRLEAVGEVTRGIRTDLVAELVDRDGKPISSSPIYRLPSQGCTTGGCDHHDEDQGRPPYAFQAFLPDVEPGAELRIRKEHDTVWSRTAPEAPPRVEGFEAEAGKEGLRLRWSIDTAAKGEDAQAWVQWSGDEGKTWLGLATALQGSEADVDPGALPSGPVLLRLLATDGFHTAVSEPASVDIPAQPPSVAILHPRDGAKVEAGGPLRLWGAATRSGGLPVERGSARWYLDGDEAGEDLDVFITAPDEGDHECTLVVEADDHREEASVRFTTVGRRPRMEQKQAP